MGGHKQLLILFICLIVSGCSQLLEKFAQDKARGETTVFFGAQRDPANSPLALLDGGIMIYAKSATGSFARIGMLANEVTGGSMTLPNGEYYFSAIAWTGAALTGNPYCGANGGSPTGDRVVLNGTPVSVNINLTTATCKTSAFTNPLYQSGSTILPLSLVFCGEAVDISGKGPSSLCISGEEGRIFFRGSPNANIIEERGNAYGSFAFIADSIDGTTPELFGNVIDTSNLATVERKISGRQLSAAGVTKFRFSPNGRDVLYVGRDQSSTPELYVTPYDQQAPVRVSGTLVGGASGVQDAWFVSNNRIVFVADALTVGKFEIFGVDRDGSNLIRLNSNMVPNGNIYFNTEWSVRISPDGSKVVYLADQDTDGVVEAYRVDPFTANSSVKISGTIVGAGDVDWGEISSDNSRFIFVGDLDVFNVRELYSANLSGAPARVQHSINTANCETDSLTAGQGVSDFRVDYDYDLQTGSGKVAYLNQNGTSESVLCTTTLSGNPVLISAVTGATSTYGVQKFAFSVDGERIAWVQNAGAPDNFKRRLYQRKVDGSDSAVELTGTLGVSQGALTTFSAPFNQGAPFGFTDDSTKVIYVSDEAVAGTQELYSVNLDGSGRIKLNGTLTGGGNVVGMQIGVENNDYVYYAADQDVDTKNELYYVGPSGTPAASKLSNTASDNNMKVFSFSMVSWENAAFYIANLENPSPGYAGARQGYLARVGGSTERIATTYNPTMSGRIRVHLMRGTVSGISSFGYAPAISSSCLSGGSSEGDAINTGIYIPAGVGDFTTPFFVGIELFSRSNTCSGTGDFLLFPMGLGSPSISTNSEVTTDSSSKIRIFMND